jgi:ApaG protein
MWEATTEDVHIQVSASFLADESEPDDHEYLWAYTVTISNRGTQSVQLLNRHWIIIDARGHREEVKGPGVVGQQPKISPGDSFSYTSACPLATPSGVMRGSYDMVRVDGTRFSANIPAFSLDSPHERQTQN